MTPSLEQLALRCEAATGPDRELDCAIRMAVYAPEGATMEQSPINGNWCIYSGTGFRSGKPALWESNEGRHQAFTASLDAATGLFPPNTMVRSGHSAISEGFFCDAVIDGGDVVHALAQSEPGARTAAALRAISKTQGSNNG